MRISMLPTDKLMMDKMKVGFRNCSILFDMIIPMIPTGIPASNKMPPQIPTTSNNLYMALEFKTLVGVKDHQITRGVSKTSASSDAKSVLLKTVDLFFIFKVTPLIKFLFIALFFIENFIEV